MGRQRPGRVAVRDDLAAAIRAEPAWRPDYAALAAQTGYGRSWLEKRVREARRVAAQDQQPEPEPVQVPAG